MEQRRRIAVLILKVFSSDVKVFKSRHKVIVRSSIKFFRNIDSIPNRFIMRSYIRLQFRKYFALWPWYSKPPQVIKFTEMNGRKVSTWMSSFQTNYNQFFFFSFMSLLFSTLLLWHSFNRQSFLEVHLLALSHRSSLSIEQANKK